MLAAEVLESERFGCNFGLIFHVCYAVNKIGLEVLQLSKPLHIIIALETYYMGLYFVYELIVIN